MIRNLGLVERRVQDFLRFELMQLQILILILLEQRDEYLLISLETMNLCQVKISTLRLVTDFLHEQIHALLSRRLGFRLLESLHAFYLFHLFHAYTQRSEYLLEVFL